MNIISKQLSDYAKKRVNATQIEEKMVEIKEGIIMCVSAWLIVSI